jgi:hypothetical protein
MPSGKQSKLDGELDRLYGLPLKEFTPARDELAKRLRTQGERELADQVKSLRKPTVGAWLSNQLVRERELDVHRLLKAGEALSKAQTEAAGGASAEAFGDARREEQRALERLAQAAREIARREEASASALERATETLRAASLTEEGRELLRQGRLTEELQPPGFEALVGLAPGGGRARRRQPAPSRRGGAQEGDERQQVLREARERLLQLRAEERELAKRAGAVEKQAARAEKEAAERRDEAQAARAEAASAAEAVAAAEKDLEQLRA